MKRNQLDSIRRLSEANNLGITVSNGRFLLRTRLGGGSFGEIYRGYDTWRQRDVAVKLEATHSQHPQLNYESRVYKLLLHNTLEVTGFPEMHWYGTEGEFNVMVIDLCGPSLEDLFNYCGRKFSLKTVLLIADQLLHRIEFCHHKQFLHRDIKPENYVMGLGQRCHHVYMVDFGLAKRYWDNKQKRHNPYREGKPVTGTARYCSVNTHLGIEQSRRDDLESIGYVLLYFLKGSLPWQGIRNADPSQKTTLIGEKKMSTSAEHLCKDEPAHFLKFMKYSRGLKFEDAPDYAKCRAWFTDLMQREGLPRDWIMDWVVIRRLEHQR